MKLEIPVKVYFNDVQGMIDEIKRLQTYKLFEGDDMVLVDLDAVVAVMANHVKADKCSESPNGWIPCSERLPEVNGTYIVCYEDASVPMDWFNGHWFFYRTNPAVEETGTIIAWMPLPEQWKGE